MNVNSCLSKVDNYLHCPKESSEKVMLSEIEELLSFYPLPCYDPGLSKLKVYIFLLCWFYVICFQFTKKLFYFWFTVQAYAENARMLIAEIESALSSCFSVSRMQCMDNSMGFIKKFFCNLSRHAGGSNAYVSFLCLQLKSPIFSKWHFVILTWMVYIVLTDKVSV